MHRITVVAAALVVALMLASSAVAGTAGGSATHCSTGNPWAYSTVRIYADFNGTYGVTNTGGGYWWTFGGIINSTGYRYQLQVNNGPWTQPYTGAFLVSHWTVVCG